MVCDADAARDDIAREIGAAVDLHHRTAIAALAGHSRLERERALHEQRARAGCLLGVERDRCGLHGRRFRLDRDRHGRDDAHRRAGGQLGCERMRVVIVAHTRAVRVDAGVGVRQVVRCGERVGEHAAQRDALRKVAHRAEHDDLLALRRRQPFARVAGRGREPRNPVRLQSVVVRFADRHAAKRRLVVDIENRAFAHDVACLPLNFVRIHTGNGAGRSRVMRAFAFVVLPGTACSYSMCQKS